MSRRRKARDRMGHPARARRTLDAPRKAPPSPQRPARRPSPGQAPGAAKAKRGASLRAGASRRLTALLSWEPGAGRGRSAPPAPLTTLIGVDLGWAALTGALSAVLFATVLTGHPGLGDSSEAVAGVSSLGILHAPGYPAYVLVAHVFTWLVPFGSEALKVNLFSLVCAAVSVGLVQLLARRAGAARWAASLGALTLAATAGFWFYAGFAKHDVFSGLLFLIGLHLTLSCLVSPSARRLMPLAGVIGVGLGSSWPLMVLLLPTVGLALFTSRRRLTLRSLAAASAVGLVVTVGIYGFVLLRAAQNPPLNWGGATTVSGLVALVTRYDFTPHGRDARAPTGQGSPANRAATAALRPARPVPPARSAPVPAGVPTSRVVQSVTSYGIIFGRELGILGLVLAAAGAVLSLRRRRTAASSALLLTFLVNLLAAAYAVGPGPSHSLETDLTENGFLLGSYFVLACWVAIGATELVEATAGGGIPAALRDRISRRRARSADAGSGRLADPWRRRLAPGLAGLIAAAILIPSVIGHWSIAHRDSKPFADGYARTIFGSLPHGAVLFVWGQELTDPLVYRQVVYGERRDVVVVASDGVSYPWYRRQISRRLGRPLPPATGQQVPDAARAVRSLIGARPTYLDPQTAEYLKAYVGYRPTGIVEQAVSGTGARPVSSPAALAQAVSAAERAAGMPDPDWNVWPSNWLQTATYSTAELMVARAYYARHDLRGMRQALTNVLSIEPQNQTARNDLSLLSGS